MRKMEGRAWICLLLVLALLAGLALFTVRIEKNGGDWAGFYANSHVYKNGQLTVGRINDRNGKLLMRYTDSGVQYNEDQVIRKSVLQLVGDPKGNISTAASVVFKDRIIGYNRITGTSGLVVKKGREIDLTVDSEVNRVALKAMKGKNGFVSVYNWRNGEIYCLASTPTADPADEKSLEKAKDGTYINKVFSSTFAPGSTFKLVTMAALLENKKDLDEWTFTCTGSTEIAGENITCPKAHGEMNIEDALASSCNCAFATLAVELGGDTMQQYADKLRLTSSYDIDGIKTKPGSFNFDTYDINLGWAGIGQFEDEVNPVGLMVYMGAIAGEGKAAVPTIMKEKPLFVSIFKKSDETEEGEEPEISVDEEGNEAGSASARNGRVKLLSSDTACRLQLMMKNNVVKTYKEDKFPDLDMHAKSGTAETGEDKTPNAWFAGYAGDYAFVVCVEEGGYGSSVAGPIANEVLQEIKKIYG